MIPIRSAIVALVAGFVLAGCGGSGDEPGIASRGVEVAEADFAYVIPAGTGERMDAGEPVEILPRRIDATVGQSIAVRNDDDRGHTIGWLYVGPGETVGQAFTSPGTFQGICTVHPSGEVELVVSE